MSRSETPVIRAVMARTSCGDCVDTHTRNSRVRGDHDAAGFHGHGQVALLRERLLDHVRRGGEDLFEVVAPRRLEVAEHVAVSFAVVDELT